jgi:hypothetical protein
MRTLFLILIPFQVSPFISGNVSSNFYQKRENKLIFLYVCSKEERSKAYNAMVGVLAQIHAVDVKKVYLRMINLKITLIVSSSYVLTEGSVFYRQDWKIMGSTKDLFSGKSAPGPGRLIESPESNVQFCVFLRTGGFFQTIFLSYLFLIFVLIYLLEPRITCPK